jgi:uracil-DNA glycosylase
MMENINNINKDWLPFFDENMSELTEIINKVNYSNNSIFPNKQDIFKSLFYFSPYDIKCVILGQDPYISSEIHNNIKVPQACGLSFSVPEFHKKIPPSLKNIYKELKLEYPDYNIPNHGSLERWVKDEKILLLNSALTVKEGESNSHAHLWEKFTDKLIKWISEKNNSTIFLLMGNFAIKKSILVDAKKHKIFSCVHPSPLSASRGFFGSNIFININNYLIENKKEPINW